MKILDISSITDSSEFPLKRGTLQFLQDAHKETLAATIIALIGAAYSPATVYVLNGVVNSGTYPFYNGEVYLVDATTFTALGTNVGVFSIGVTQYTTDADPVTYTDSAIRNVHNIRKIVVSQGASGSTFADYLQAFFLSFAIPAPLNLTAPTDLPENADNAIIVSGAYPNIKIYTPTPPASAHPIIADGYYNVGNIPGSGGDYNIVFAAPLSTSNYYVMGTLLSQGPDAQLDTTVVWTIRGRTTAGFILHCSELGAYTQNVGFEYVIFAK